MPLGDPHEANQPEDSTRRWLRSTISQCEWERPNHGGCGTNQIGTVAPDWAKDTGFQYERRGSPRETPAIASLPVIMSDASSMLHRSKQCQETLRLDRQIPFLLSGPKRTPPFLAFLNLFFLPSSGLHSFFNRPPGLTTPECGLVFCSSGSFVAFSSHLFVIPPPTPFLVLDHLHCPLSTRREDCLSQSLFLAAMLFTGALFLLSCLHSAVAQRHDSDLMSFMTVSGAWRHSQAEMLIFVSSYPRCEP